MKHISVGILGAGAMGSGIAQVVAAAGFNVVLCDNNTNACAKSRKRLDETLKTLVEKGKMEGGEAYALQSRIKYTDHMSDFRDSTLVIEAIVEDLEQKQIAFRSLDAIVGVDCILATNTSSLSISAIGAPLKCPERLIGVHFFNPAPLMALVEIIPALQTNQKTIDKTLEIVAALGKITVLAKDTPGFVVNRIARPYYGEAMRICEEGIADPATIDWAMREMGGFKMGPFELMDFIGHDINYRVTKIVFEESFYDQRYKPSYLQRQLVDAHWFGRKCGRGFYRYDADAPAYEPLKDEALGKEIYKRILVMLINEATDAFYLKVGSREDIDLAMTTGVNYPKGLLKWADELGIAQVVEKMDALYDEYHEDRYRCSPLLRRMAREGSTFYGL
jgi:3-hydroxybutyryl-CoA dehydrogenase